MKKTIKWEILLFSLGISLGAGALASLLSPSAAEQYAKMYKPPLSPPGWIFPIVWTVLYILMGLAAYLVYIMKSPEGNRALKYYGAQLAVNLLWPLLFFRLEAYLIALAWLMLLWYLLFETRRQFGRLDPRAGRLLLPSLIWVSFAFYLNLAVVLHYF